MKSILVRLQFYSILKSDWSGAWLLLAIVTRTVNSIVSAGYLHKICFKWSLFSKSRRFYRDSLSALLWRYS